MLAGLLTLCLVPRMIMAWRMPGICPDAVLYIRLGKAIEVGQFQQGLGNIRFNIYPVILSYLHQLGLSWETAGVAWGVIISSCTVLPLFGWIRCLFSRRVAIAACILYAIHSGLIRWSVEIIRDSTFWFLLTLSLYLTWRAVTELRWAWNLAAGTAIALACLTRFEGMVLFVPLAAWLWRRLHEGHGSRNRLVAVGLVCVSIYPLSLMLVNALWIHGRTTYLVRVEPMALAQDCAQESITGRPAQERRSRTDLLAPLPLWTMAQRFVTGMFKGFTPLYLLAVVGGIAAWHRVPTRHRPCVHGARIAGERGTGCLIGVGRGYMVSGPPGEFDTGTIPSPQRRDYWALAYAGALILAAIWVHLYWSHEAGPRYFFSIVIMAAPLAGWGLLQITAAVANRVRRQHSPMAALLAAAALLVAILVVNLYVVWSSDFHERAAAVDLGHWVQERYGPAARVFGPDGITQVVNYYAHGRCESFPETASASLVVSQMRRLRPDVVLLATDRCGVSGDEVFACIAGLGFEAIDQARLPGGCEKVQVLARRTGGNGATLADGTSTAHEVRLPVPVTADGTRSVPATLGDKPRS